MKRADHPARERSRALPDGSRSSGPARRCRPARRDRPARFRTAGIQRCAVMYSKNLSFDRRRGRSGILRIERIDENALAALAHQKIGALGDGRLAVAHRPIDDDGRRVGPCGSRACRPCALVKVRSGDSFFSVFPDRRIGRAGLLRPRVEDDAVEDRIPGRTRPIRSRACRRENSLQIAPHRLEVGFRRACPD